RDRAGGRRVQSRADDGICSAYFPAWMLCAAVGIVTAVIIRLSLAVAGINEYVFAPLLTYAGLAVSADVARLALLVPSLSDVGHCQGAHLVSLIALVGVLLTVVFAAHRIDQRPRTDDAYPQADLVHMAPDVSGRIVELDVRDNQAVRKGDALRWRTIALMSA